MKTILSLFIFFSLTTICPSQEILITCCEEMPEFPGGEVEMFKFIQSHFYYPESALKEGIEGRVTVRFVVNEDGNINTVTLVRGLHPECDSVAISIIKAMPRWKPGSQGGERVSVYFTLPILFKIPESTVKTKVYQLPDKKPVFPGGKDEIHKFIERKLKAPFRLSDSSPKVSVMVRFVVTKEGKTSNIEILKSMRSNKKFEEEARRIVKIMPDWTPAIHNGTNVDAYYQLVFPFATDD
jgi:TonB family protein